ncbi:MAG: hypothetical protein LBH11_03380 [Propionibacteriaceae bacterium]|nr:hypothetical protein [Propionibacteriaceae bacterium]
MTLLELEERYPRELAADFREFYSLSFSPGDTLTWGEAWLLVNALAIDARSRTHAAYSGWTCPASHETQALYDLFDLVVAVNTPTGKQRLRHPRPWDTPTTAGDASKFTQEEVRRILQERGPQHG